MSPKPLRGSVLVFAAIIAVSSAQEIVIFGDSLSDNGNGYSAYVKFVLRTNESYPESPYYQGRWSNGPTWIEDAASQLGKQLTNYAAGGATTGSAPAQVPPLPIGFGDLTLPTTVLTPTLPQQLNAHFLATNNSLDPSAVYIIFIGGNDFFSIVLARTNVTASTVAGNIEDAAQQLYNKGARKFILVGGGDLSSLPVFTQPSVYGYYPRDLVEELRAQSLELNMLVQEIISEFPYSHPGSTVTYFDWGKAVAQVAMSPSNYGITNIQQGCYVIAPDLKVDPTPIAQPIGAPGGQVCSNPDAHLYWDQFHPTRKTHRHVGDVFAQQLGPLMFGAGPSSAPSPSALPVLPQSPTAASG